MTDNTEFLNLDDVSPEVRKVITLKGVKYAYKTPTVADFAREMQAAKDVRAKLAKKKGEMTDDEAAEISMKIMLDAIRSAFPDMPDEVIDGLSMDQVAAIRKFIDAEIKADSEEAEDASGNA